MYMLCISAVASNADDVPELKALKDSIQAEHELMVQQLKMTNTQVQLVLFSHIKGLSQCKNRVITVRE